MTPLSEPSVRATPSAKGEWLSGTFWCQQISTDRTDKAVQMAGIIAAADGACVTLVHVIDTIDGLRPDELKRIHQRLHRKARGAMSALARRAPTGAANAPSNAVAFGRRAEQIVEYAVANTVDLIVLASHRVNLSLINRDWGSISYKVGILAQCPVLLVK
jgi:nucleotide-binding universal stress UspA family protein